MWRRTLLVAFAGRLWTQEPNSLPAWTWSHSSRPFATRGLLAKNLSRDDFVLQEDGVPQTIR